MKAIVAVSENWGIGFKGSLLFSIPEDMRRFKELTLNKAVVMGRKTLESLPGGKPLPNRVNIVLTGDKNYKPSGVTVCDSVSQTLDEIKKHPADDVFIIGGERVYKEFLNYCDKVLITKIRAVKPADTFFPDLDKDKNWIKTWESEVKEYDGLEFTFSLYMREARSGD